MGKFFGFIEKFIIATLIKNNLVKIKKYATIGKYVVVSNAHEH